MEKKNFFRNESERNLWIRLNAELIQYFAKKLHGEDKIMGNVDDPSSCMWHSKGQLEYYERHRDALDFSLEELLLLPLPVLFRIALRREMEEDIENFRKNVP